MISSKAPTLFGRKTENWRTSGPPSLDVVSGKSSIMSCATVGEAACFPPPGRWQRPPTEFGHARISHCRSCSGKPILNSPKMDEENELIALRRKKLETLRARGVEPFGKSFDIDGNISEIREKFKEDETLRAAGRITAHRDMGQSHFLDLRDATGRIQIYIQAKEVGPELIELVPLLDLGDFLAVEGVCFSTKTGEPTLRVR